MVRAQDLTVDSEVRPHRRRRHRRRSLIAGALLAALLSSLSVTLVTHLWSLPLHVPFQYTQTPSDDEQDATLDMMLIKNIHETGWFNTNPKLNAPFAQRWAEWPMGGDLLAYTVKKALVDTTGDVPLTFNLFWLLTFPSTALAAFPALRALRCSWSTALVGAVLFSLAPYHFRNGAAHENLAFYVGVPVIVLICAKVLGPDAALPSLAALRHRRAWWRPPLVAARLRAHRCHGDLLPRVSPLAPRHLRDRGRARATPTGPVGHRRTLRSGGPRHLGARQPPDAALPVDSTPRTC